MKKNQILFTAAVLFFLSITMASAFPPFKNGKVVMMITLEVKNFSEWKKGFDNGSSVRDKAGIKVLSVCSSIKNENEIIVVEEAENAQAAHDFLTLLKGKQKDGDLSKLEVKLYDKVE